MLHFDLVTLLELYADHALTITESGLRLFFFSTPLECAFMHRPPTCGLEWWLSLALTAGLTLTALQWVLSHLSGCAFVIYNVARDCPHMAPGKISYPSVFVVDSPTRPPPLPPKPSYRHRQKGIQTLLVVLVVVALCGMTVEACFIYRLYATKDQPVSTTPVQLSEASLSWGLSFSINTICSSQTYLGFYFSFLIFFCMMLFSLYHCGLLEAFIYLKQLDWNDIELQLNRNW